MTFEQRQAAARKAAAARRLNRMNGTTVHATSAPRKRAFSTPAPNYRGLKLIALAALEDAFVVRLREHGITDDVRKAFAQYQKLKALALGPQSNSAMQNEADTALRMATVNLVKVTF